jgi:hypothetical protein
LTEATSLSGGDGHKRVPFVPNQKINTNKKEKPAIDKDLEKKQQKKCIKENEQLVHPDLDLILPAGLFNLKEFLNDYFHHKNKINSCFKARKAF